MSAEIPGDLGVDISPNKVIVREFDWNSREEPALTVINTVATVAGDDPTQLGPLSNTVDPDALNALWKPEQNENRSSSYVQFDYEDCRIRLTGDGKALVVALEE